MKKTILYIMILIITLFGIILPMFFGEESNIKQNPAKDEETNILIDEINNDLSLTIYYLPLGLLTLYPLTESDLVNGHYDYKIIIKNGVLRNYVNYLEQIGKLKLQKVKSKDRENIRIYGQFSNKNGKVYSFGLSGYYGSILVNGVQYTYNKVFYDFVANFIPSCEIDSFQKRTKEP